MKLSTINSRHSTVRKAWLCWWLQHRRRKRATPTPNAPVITNLNWAWDQTVAGWVDIYLEFSFDQGDFPVASLEVWVQREGTDPAVLVATIASTETSYWHTQATQIEEFLYYKLRYVGDGVTGPFCGEATVIPYHLPATPSDLGGSTDEGGGTLLTWNMDGVSYEDGCSVEGRKDSDPFAEITTTGPDVDSVFLGVPSGSWDFRVRAFNAHGVSDYTNTAHVNVI